MKYELIIFIIINIIGLGLIAIDKSKAKRHEWRIAEKTLFLIALLGGSLGTLLGMYTFRHKTKHLKFVFGIPGIILLQVFVMWWILK